MPKPSHAGLMLLALLAGCSASTRLKVAGAPAGHASAVASASPRRSAPTSTETVTLIGAGDIAICGSTDDDATARLLDSFPQATIFTVGDNAYHSGSADEYRDCYDASWGRHRARTRPSPGNHEYYTEGAAGYYSYFGALAGDSTKGYYSYDLGAWHIIALNSNLSMASGSTQEQWLRADLAASAQPCVLAYWHAPRFSSGQHGNAPETQPLWQALYDAGADVILGGHDHTYERFARQTPSGEPDSARGIRQFVVGTGGASHYAESTLQRNSERFDGTTFGVLKLTLAPGDYRWEFIPVPGGTFRDAGSDRCGPKRRVP